MDKLTTPKNISLLDISVIECKLKHNKHRLTQKHQYHNAVGIDNINYHGGRAIEYLEGGISALEDVIDAYYSL